MFSEHVLIGQMDSAAQKLTPLVESVFLLRWLWGFATTATPWCFYISGWVNLEIIYICLYSFFSVTNCIEFILLYAHTTSGNIDNVNFYSFFIPY